MRVEKPADAWLIDGRRSPFGRFGGALRETPLPELGAHVVEATLKVSGWPKELIDELDVGTGMIESGLMVPARIIAMRSGLGENLPSLTIDRACCSGASTVGMAARALATGAKAVMCLGVETLSRTPFLLHDSRWGQRLGGPAVEDLLLMQSPLTGTAIARYVGEVALDHGVTRTDQDQWALQSHERYFAALESGFFDDEIVPISTPRGEFAVDEHPRRDTSLEALAALPTVRDSPTVTAGNAPGLNDGACAVIVATEATAADHDVAPLARIVSYLQTAGAPNSSAYLPGVAILELVAEAGLSLLDLDVIEINEAYAATPLVSARRMAGDDPGLERDFLSRINKNGGAVAIGHPLGASGARLVLTAARELTRSGGRYAAVAICGGFGQTDALLLERVDA